MFAIPVSCVNDAYQLERSLDHCQNNAHNIRKLMNYSAQPINGNDTDRNVVFGLREKFYYLLRANSKLFLRV